MLSIFIGTVNLASHLFENLTKTIHFPFNEFYSDNYIAYFSTKTLSKLYTQDH